MDIERLLLSRGMTRKQLHAKSAMCGMVAALGSAAVAWIDFVAAHWPRHHLLGFVFGGLAVMNAGLALIQYVLSRKAGKGAV